jgi:hypothetical protein
MKCQSYICHKIFVLAAFMVFFFSAVPCYSSIYEVLYDPEGFRYDVVTSSGTCIQEGTVDAYDNGYYLKINGVNYNANNLTISGRNIIGTTETLSGLRVTRKLYVPASKDGPLGNFGRWYDSLYNPTPVPTMVI